MRGLMMDMPLLISEILEHGARYHSGSEIVSRSIEGPMHRYTLKESAQRIRQLANALQALGVQQGDCIGTLAWNGFRHFEAYFGISGIGAVCHTINPRLFPAQIVYIINHAKDKYIFVDITFIKLLESISDKIPSNICFVIMTDRNHMPDTHLKNVICYEELIESHSNHIDWPQFDENTASSLCYTSGTTGDPKGVLYSHRSTVLHSIIAIQPDAMALSVRDCILPVVPMFHVNAWGIPYLVPITGAKLVMPGPALDGASLYSLMESECVTFAAGVPTIWQSLLQHVRQVGLRFSSLKRTVIGGSAASPAMIEEFRQSYGVTVLHAWGMTETSPLGTVNTPKPHHASLPADERTRLRNCQGRALYGIQLRITDDNGQELPRDGKAFGHLEVRGPWVASEYFRANGTDSFRTGGWFDTGDVANLDPDGFIQIVDRSKDVIKSGGEWISSIELENIAMGHADVLEAAVISIRHPKWEERPLLIITPKEGRHPKRDDILAYYTGKVAKWWIPDDVVMLPELPHTATGKLSKLALRQRYADYVLPEN